ncbi:hypothetical protein [endosymbiont GvMRE of Glomus versiforme]|uniref:hypothetical protein n=1 Tax=endosymbiont GvMRE of Glomus versiforme TaxID=2039283 RepID=UPI0011C471A6|nr:hypothetical protein [endosymbiont GvMRE of Glomus versiforme]
MRKNFGKNWGGVIKKIDDDSELGETQTVKNIKQKTKELLEIYDENNKGEEGYEEIDLEELTDEKKRTELSLDLAKNREESKWWGIIKDVKKLENLVVDYQKTGSLEVDKTSQSQNHPTQQQTVINVNQQAQILQKEPGFPPGSSKNN